MMMMLKQWWVTRKETPLYLFGSNFGSPSDPLLHRGASFLRLEKKKMTKVACIKVNCMLNGLSSQPAPAVMGRACLSVTTTMYSLFWSIPFHFSTAFWRGGVNHLWLHLPWFLKAFNSITRPLINQQETCLLLSVHNNKPMMDLYLQLTCTCQRGRLWRRSSCLQKGGKINRGGFGESLRTEAHRKQKKRLQRTPISLVYSTCHFHGAVLLVHCVFQISHWPP